MTIAVDLGRKAAKQTFTYDIKTDLCVCDSVYQNQTAPKGADKSGASYTVCHSFTTFYKSHQVVS